MRSLNCFHYFLMFYWWLVIWNTYLELILHWHGNVCTTQNLYSVERILAKILTKQYKTLQSNRNILKSIGANWQSKLSINEHLVKFVSHCKACRAISTKHSEPLHNNGTLLEVYWNKLFTNKHQLNVHNLQHFPFHYFRLHFYF